MNRKFLFHGFFVLSLVLLVLNFSYALSPIVSASNLNIFIVQTSGIAFQSNGNYVLLSSTTGNLNTSTNSLMIYESSGYFRFYSNETVTLTITFDMTTVRVGGDKTHELRAINSGNLISIDAGDDVIVEWGTVYQPLFPLLFILGMFGIVGIIGGSLWTVHKVKRKEYIVALREGTVLIVLGIALFLAWLFPL